MNVTELLVTGYDGDQPVFAVNLANDTASVVTTGTDAKGETSVESTYDRASQAFTGVRDLIKELTTVPAK